MDDPFAIKLYKFRPLESLPFLFDILINQRLYCSPYSLLNDPFEGQFQILKLSQVLSDGTEPKDDCVPQFRTASQELRVCSLSCANDDVRMWSLYAGGHSGVAVEVSLNPSEIRELHRVNYLPSIPSVIEPLLGDTACTEALTTKTNHWKYESEWRILTESDYFDVSRNITRLILGYRTPPNIATALERVCAPAGIPVSKTTICRDTTRVILID